MQWQCFWGLNQCSSHYTWLLWINQLHWINNTPLWNPASLPIQSSCYPYVSAPYLPILKRILLSRSQAWLNPDCPGTTPNIYMLNVFLMKKAVPSSILLFRHLDRCLTYFITGVIHKIASLLELISSSIAQIHRENLAFIVKILMPKFTFSN